MYLGRLNFFGSVSFLTVAWAFFVTFGTQMYKQFFMVFFREIKVWLTGFRCRQIFFGQKLSKNAIVGG